MRKRNLKKTILAAALAVPVAFSYPGWAVRAQEDEKVSTETEAQEVMQDNTAPEEAECEENPAYDEMDGAETDSTETDSTEADSTGTDISTEDESGQTEAENTTEKKSVPAMRKILLMIMGAMILILIALLAALGVKEKKHKKKHKNKHK